MRKVKVFKIVMFLSFICFVFANIMFMINGSNTATNSVSEEKQSNDIHLNFDSDDNLRETDEKLVILTWTNYYGSPLSEARKSMSELGCSQFNHKCIFTDDRKSVRRANALLFHWRDTNINDLPTNFRANDQIWILYNWETPCYSKSLLSSNDNIYFNWTTSYRLDSTLLGPTTTIAKRDKDLNPNYEPNLSGKTKTVAWIVSHCNTLSHREEYVKEMQKYVSVDIFGKCGQNKCESHVIDDCYEQVARQYRFYLAFENSICKDYVTEKLWLALKHDIIPIVFGGANYSELLPPNSFIDALRYTPKQLSDYIKELIDDDEKYKSYFEWKSTYFVKIEGGFSKYVCIVCDALNKWRENGKPRVSYSVRDIMRWYFTDANCQSWGGDTQMCTG